MLARKKTEVRMLKAYVPTPQAIAGASWPIYMVVMAFTLLIGIEVALFMFIYFRWGRRDGRRDEHWEIDRDLAHLGQRVREIHHYLDKRQS